jgi:hypothetical protein
MFLNKPTLHITLMGVWKQVQGGSISDLIVRLFGLERIKYWIFRPVFRNNYRTIIVGLDGAEEPALDRMVAVNLVDTAKQWVRALITIPCKEFIGFEQDIIEVNATIGAMSLGGADVRYVGGRGEGGRGGRGGRGDARSYREAMRSPGEDSISGGAAASWSSTPIRQTSSYASSDSGQEQLLVVYQQQLAIFTNKIEVIEERNAVRDRQVQAELNMLKSQLQQNENALRSEFSELNHKVGNDVRDMKLSLDAAVALIVAAARGGSSGFVDDVTQAAHGRNPHV